MLIGFGIVVLVTCRQAIILLKIVKYDPFVSLLIAVKLVSTFI